jgi:hypothetical protein
MTAKNSGLSSRNTGTALRICRILSLQISTLGNNYQGASSLMARFVHVFSYIVRSLWWLETSIDGFRCTFGRPCYYCGCGLWPAFRFLSNRRGTQHSGKIEKCQLKCSNELSSTLTRELRDNVPPLASQPCVEGAALTMSSVHGRSPDQGSENDTRSCLPLPHDSRSGWCLASSATGLIAASQNY